MADDTLTNLRKQIDAIDESILDLLEKRMMITDEVGKYKISQGLPVLNTAREKEMLERLRNLCKHPVLKESITDIFSQIIIASKNSQNIIKKI